MNPKRAIRRWLWPKSLGGKVLGVCAFGSILMVVLWMAAYFTTERQLAEAWKFSEEFGLSNDPAKLFGPPIPEDENAVIPFRRAIQMAMKRCLHGSVASQNGRSILDPDHLASIDEVAADSVYESAMAEADRRGKFHSLSNLSASLLHADIAYVSDVRYLTTTELAISRWLASHNRMDEAVQRLVRYGRLIRRWSGSEPMMWSVLFASGAELAVFGEINMLLRKSSALARSTHSAVDVLAANCEDSLSSYMIAAQSEKLAIAEGYDENAIGNRVTLLKPYRNLDKLFLLEYFDQTMTVTSTEPAELREAHRRLLRQKSLSSSDLFHRLLYPMSSTSIPQGLTLYLQRPRVVAVARCLRIVNAMSRRHDFSVEIESLGLPIESLVDPFDGQRLRIVRREDGEPTIYSIGWNFKDDGGVIDTPGQIFDVGLGPCPPNLKATTSK